MGGWEARVGSGAGEATYGNGGGGGSGGGGNNYDTAVPDAPRAWSSAPAAPAAAPAAATAAAERSASQAHKFVYAAELQRQMEGAAERKRRAKEEERAYEIAKMAEAPALPGQFARTSRPSIRLQQPGNGRAVSFGDSQQQQQQQDVALLTSSGALSSPTALTREMPANLDSDAMHEAVLRGDSFTRFRHKSPEELNRIASRQRAASEQAADLERQIGERRAKREMEAALHKAEEAAEERRLKRERAQLEGGSEVDAAGGSAAGGVSAAVRASKEDRSVGPTSFLPRSPPRGGGGSTNAPPPSAHAAPPDPTLDDNVQQTGMTATATRLFKLRQTVAQLNASKASGMVSGGGYVDPPQRGGGLASPTPQIAASSGGGGGDGYGSSMGGERGGTSGAFLAADAADREARWRSSSGSSSVDAEGAYGVGGGGDVSGTRDASYVARPPGAWRGYTDDASSGVRAAFATGGAGAAYDSLSELERVRAMELELRRRLDDQQTVVARMQAALRGAPYMDTVAALQASLAAAQLQATTGAVPEGGLQARFNPRVSYSNLYGAPPPHFLAHPGSNSHSQPATAADYSGVALAAATGGMPYEPITNSPPRGGGVGDGGMYGRREAFGGGVDAASLWVPSGALGGLGSPNALPQASVLTQAQVQQQQYGYDARNPPPAYVGGGGYASGGAVAAIEILNRSHAAATRGGGGVEPATGPYQSGGLLSALGIYGGGSSGAPHHYGPSSTSASSSAPSAPVMPIVQHRPVIGSRALPSNGIAGGAEGSDLSLRWVGKARPLTAAPSMQEQMMASAAIRASEGAGAAFLEAQGGYVHGNEAASFRASGGGPLSATTGSFAGGADAGDAFHQQQQQQPRSIVSAAIVGRPPLAGGNGSLRPPRPAAPLGASTGSPPRFEELQQAFANIEVDPRGHALPRAGADLPRVGSDVGGRGGAAEWEVVGDTPDSEQTAAAMAESLQQRQSSQTEAHQPWGSIVQPFHPPSGTTLHAPGARPYSAREGGHLDIAAVDLRSNTHGSLVGESSHAPIGGVAMQGLHSHADAWPSVAPVARGGGGARAAAASASDTSLDASTLLIYIDGVRTSVSIRPGQDSADAIAEAVAAAAHSKTHHAHPPRGAASASDEGGSLHSSLGSIVSPTSRLGAPLLHSPIVRPPPPAEVVGGGRRAQSRCRGCIHPTCRWPTLVHHGCVLPSGRRRIRCGWNGEPLCWL